LGTNLWVGAYMDYKMSTKLLDAPRDKGLVYLSQVSTSTNSMKSWLSTRDIGLPPIGQVLIFIDG